MLQIEVSRVTNEAEHELALARINALWDRTDQDALDEMNIITLLVDIYERDQFPIGEPGDPVDVLKGAIEHAGHTQTDLTRLLGSSSRASEILSRKRALTIEMIDTISVAWGIPRELLARPYEVDRTVTVQIKARPSAEAEKIRKIITQVRGKKPGPHHFAQKPAVEEFTRQEDDVIAPVPKKPTRRKAPDHPQ